jgi:hypothetical protein
VDGWVRGGGVWETNYLGTIFFCKLFYNYNLKVFNSKNKIKLKSFLKHFWAKKILLLLCHHDYYVLNFFGWKIISQYFLGRTVL